VYRAKAQNIGDNLRPLPKANGNEKSIVIRVSPRAFTKSALQYYVFSKIGGTLTKTEANRPVFSDFHVPLTRGTVSETSRDIGT
jgi:hypothetical protein